MIVAVHRSQMRALLAKTLKELREAMGLKCPYRPSTSCWGKWG